MKWLELLTNWCISVIMVFLGLTVLGIDRSAHGQVYRQNIGPVMVEDLRWQILPQPIRAVFVGPDARIWHQLLEPAYEEDVTMVRRIIEGQFHETAPQLYGAEPALFESNGRIWFRTHSHKRLLGYDGVDWVDCPANGSAQFTGSCPGHGRVSRCEYNLEVDGVLFFPDEHGVHAFNGRSWDYQNMGATAADTRIVVRAEPTSRGVIAINPADFSRLWYCRQGQWREETLAETEIQDVLPAWSDGVWLLTTDHLLRFHALGDGDAARLPTGNIPETLWPPRFYLLHCDGPAGRCFFRMEWPTGDGPAVRSDLVILNEAEEPTVIANYTGPARWDVPWREDSGPILAPDGRSIWILGRDDGKGCDKLDLATGQLVDRVPNPAFFWIHAVHEDGTVFIGDAEPGPHPSPVAVYRPGAPMPTNTLDARAYVVPADPYQPWVCVDSTGDVWAVMKDRNLWQFDGTSWRPFKAMAKYEYISMLLPGAAGRLIVRTNYACYYRADGAMTKYSSLREAIAQNVGDIVANYGAATPPARCYLDMWTFMVADRGGNVWLLEQQKLSVFADGQWVDARSALLAGGSTTGTVDYLNTVGGRDGVYMTDFDLLSSGGHSFFARVEGGRIVVSDAPHCVDRAPMQLSVRDPEDALWVPGRVSRAVNGCDVTEGQLALRVGSDGVIQQFRDFGWAQLCDASGVVWMGNIWNNWANRLSLWREGEIRGQVEIPFDPGWLCSDAEGSVYAWTKAGLYHLTASASSGFTDYAVSGYWLKPVLPGNILQFACSEKGFIVLRTYSDGAPREFHVVMIPLPK